MFYHVLHQGLGDITYHVRVEGTRHFETLALSRLALFPGSCVGEEEREPGTHCSHMCQVPLVTCILLRYTKVTINFCLPAEGRTA